ncbi:hypothetical protein [Umezawaea tangerina]|uniref:hypothetical protein n=1 Tax=Umezawaea tangerina TaxID=84725 RepID=UPI0014733330|nr:hypothetical protein [Umezawaea tangerina]
MQQGEFCHPIGEVRRRGQQLVRNRGPGFGNTAVEVDVTVDDTRLKNVADDNSGNFVGN